MIHLNFHSTRTRARTRVLKGSFLIYITYSYGQRQGLLFMLGCASISFQKIGEKYVGNQSKLSNSCIFKGNFGKFRRDE